MTPVQRRAIRVLVNGASTDVVDVGDRGLQYGHGMFETCRVVAGRVPLWRYHRARLVDSALRLGINLEPTTLEAEVDGLIADQAHAVVKIIITAGGGERGYRFESGFAGRILSVFPSPTEAPGVSRGVTVRLCRTPLSIQPALAGMKHLNRLEQIIARAEWTDPVCLEGLMCDTAGRLVEATAMNLFLVKPDRIVTPALHRCGVAGVMRRALIEDRPGIDLPIEIRDVKCDEIASADECFLSNAVVGVWPVRHVLGIGDIGRSPGRIVAAVRTALEARFGFPDTH